MKLVVELELLDAVDQKSVSEDFGGDAVFYFNWLLHKDGGGFSLHELIDEDTPRVIACRP